MSCSETVNHSITGHAITESKVLTDHLSHAQIEVLHVPDVDILDYKLILMLV